MNSSPLTLRSTDVPAPRNQPLAELSRPSGLRRVAAGSQGLEGPAGRAARPSLTCVLPCRNEASNLAILLPRLRQALESLASAWEVIVVDDGSSDGTAELLERWTEFAGFRCVQLSRNFGKEAALTAGLEAAQGDVVVMLDADLQHDPALLPEMVERWRRGADVVYTVRRNRDDESPLKQAGARWFYRLINLGDRFDVPAGAGDFRLMDRAAVDALLALPERTRFMKGLYAWVGFRSEAMPYTPAPRLHGSTRFNFWSLAKLSLDGLTAFTTWPLRLVSLLGFCLSLLGFFYGAFLVGSYALYGNHVSGWTTIVVTQLLFFGMQLVATGIVGEYIGRIFAEVKGRPLYIVRRSLGRGLAP